ncbi:MAG: polysaccharide deacetylase family protein [Candidatus Acidiferrales bacterium]
MTRKYGWPLCAVAALLCTSLAWNAFGARPAPAQNSSNAQESTRREVAITVDDLPGALPGSDFAYGDLKELQKINHGIPGVLKAHHAWAIGFVNERKLQVQGERDARAALLQMWLDDGLFLGNHTYSHADFSTTPLQEYEDETIRGEVVTGALLKARGEKELYFRHPYLDTGISLDAKNAFDAFLKARGYIIAPVTIEDADYVFNDALAHAYETKDKKLAAKAKREYLEYVDTVFNYAESESEKLFSRQIPQVLLIHDNALNTECLDGLLTRLEQRGYKFVSLQEAMTDPAYATPDLWVGTGVLWMERWKIAMGLKPEPDKGPDPPKWASDIFDQMRKERQKE